MTDRTDFDRPTFDRTVIRAVPHPDELRPRGLAIACARCGATRDWLLLNVRALVFVRCRCAHEWHESDLTRADFDESFTSVERTWSTLEEAMTALAFDGLLAGAIWD
ncbi:hypothetical protein ACIRST_29040 [Kitasatospora sp. NPDC101447]|uniref:hypothetical protein n=1 Tax=Kitasatospora sp. NPDC101447 TaxID=3364102 RepID=UPI003811E077